MKKENQKLEGQIRASFATRKFRGGAYAMLLSLIAVVMALLVNLIATKLDIRLDLTAEGKYSLAQETVSLLQGLKDDVSIYFLVESGQEDYYDFDRLFSKYDDYSDKVTLAYKDPILYPRFASEYVDDEVTVQSFLVVNEATKKAKYVSFYDLVITELNYSTMQMEITGTDLEGQLDAAIQYVTNDHLPTLYAVAGHGEGATGSGGSSVVSGTLSSLLEKGNITVNEITLITQESIPEDCDILFLYQPKSDYTEEEATMVKEYLMDGGDAIFMVDYVTPELPNFNSLLAFYGIDVQAGVVLEENSNYYAGQMPFMLLPSVKSSEITDSVRGKKYVVAAYGSGMTLREDIRSSITTTDLLTTSDTAFIKAFDSTTLQKESGDVSGMFRIGIALSETLMEEETKIAVFSSQMFLDDSVLAISSYGNAELFINTINTFSEQENAVSVAPRSVEEERITLTSAQANRIALIVAIILPLCIIGAGIFVVVRRRKR